MNWEINSEIVNDTIGHKGTDNLEIKKMIAFLSIGHGLAKKSTKLYPLEQDEIKRIDYMRKAIKNKFDKIQF